MNIKTVLAALIFASFIANDTHTSQDYKEESSVTKHCNNGRCHLGHFYKESHGASFYMKTDCHDLNPDTPIIIINKEEDCSITSGKELEQRKKLRNYFPTKCSLPNFLYSPFRSYPIKFYVLKEKNDTEKYAPVDCKNFEILIIEYVAQQDYIASRAEMNENSHPNCSN